MDGDGKATTTRRTFIGALSAGVSAGLFPHIRAFAAPDRRRRWFRGMIHAHTCWSDGRALPDQAVKAYRDAGYDFFAITDHNCIGKDPDRWMQVGELGPGWPPKVIDVPVFEAFRRDFPDLKWREEGGTRFVRVSTLRELAERFNEPGRFLLVPGCEVTLAGPARLSLHMNYVGMDSVIPSVDGARLIHVLPELDISRAMRQTAAEVAALAAEKGGAPHVCWVNHPHWPYFDVNARHLVENPEVRFFEVCNNGADFAPVPPLASDGLYCDRLWDAVLAARFQRGEPPLYALAVEDTHFYPGSGTRHRPIVFRDAWIGVAAEGLSQKDIFGAMERGDFYASCGVDFDAIDFDRESGVLSVAVPAKAGVSYKVRFIVTARGADAEPQSFVTIPAKGSRPERTVPVYADGIGATAKLESFGRGERAVASYRLRPEDLYVRARVESDEPAVCLSPTHPPVKMGWTQPCSVCAERVNMV